MPILFDGPHYSAQWPASEGLNSPQAAWRHYMAHPLEADPSPYFDTAYYCQHYPDGRKTDGDTPLEDFLRHLRKGTERRTHPLIDPDFYRAQSEGLAPEDSALLHFMRHGDRENRPPSAAFDSAFYVRCYLPLQSCNPFAHYVHQGRARGYLPCARPRDADEIADFWRQTGPIDLILVGHDAQQAGAPIVLLEALRRLQARGLRVLVLLQNAGPLLEPCRALAPVLVLAEGWPVAPLLAACRPGTPVIANTVVSLPVALAAHRAGLPVLVAVQELALTITQSDMGPACQEAVDAGLRFGFSNRATRDAFETLLSAPLPPDQQRILGVALVSAPPAPDQVRAVKAMMKGRRPAIIGAGHADYRKGFDLFLDTARAIQKRKKRAHFFWLGALDPWAWELASKARAEGLALILPGFVDSVTAWFSAADLYLMTSRSDAGPGTLQAALVSGCPCAGFTDQIGLAEDLRRYGAGLPGHDPEALAAAAIPLLRQRLPETVTEALRAGYDFDACLTRMLEALPPGAR